MLVRFHCSRAESPPVASHCVTEKALTFLSAWQVPTRSGSSCLLKLLFTLLPFVLVSRLKIDSMSSPRNGVLLYFSSLVHTLIKSPFFKRKSYPTSNHPWEWRNSSGVKGTSAVAENLSSVPGTHMVAQNHL